MYGPIHPTTTQQTAIGGIDYGIHFEPCNIPLYNLYIAHGIHTPRNDPYSITSMSTLPGILILGLVIWFWLDSARARELATAICAKACELREVQFLDQTVALNRIGISRTKNGIRLRRTFRFDFSDEGATRHSGHIVMLGTAMLEFSLGLPTEQ
jgi:hypothetical protein